MSETGAQLGDVRIELLGRFRVALGGREITESDWPARRAQELVALLALADRHRLLRERVVEQLWPHLGADAGAANLRKAAHHARRTLADPEAIVLRSGHVELFPARAVTTDVERFLRDADSALRGSDTGACAEAAAGCPGELLPDAPYEEWTQEPRRQVHARLTQLLRRSAGWERLMEVEPTDEAACRELMRAAIDAGRRHVAIRWYERLRIAMVRELGAQPGAETRALYDQCTAGVRLGERAFVGRELELAGAMGHLKAVAGGGTSALIVRGATGIGKSAFCREVAPPRTRARLARHHGHGDGRRWRRTPRSPRPSSSSWSHGRASLDALPERTRSVLAELSPLARPGPPLQGALTRHQVVAALRRALALAEGPPRRPCCASRTRTSSTRRPRTSCTSSSAAAAEIRCWCCSPTARSGCARACRAA